MNNYTVTNDYIARNNHVAKYHTMRTSQDGGRHNLSLTSRYGISLHNPNKLVQQQRRDIMSAIYSKSPASVQPYLALIRFDKPIGTWLLYLPCTWSIALAANNTGLPDAKILALFACGAFIMRGAGCIINDMWDSDYDRKVSRTSNRPLAANQLTHKEALGFLAVMLSGGLSVLLSLNWYSVFLGATSMGLVVTYPLMKRFTYWPQMVLGLTFNWGTLLGWSAVQGSCDWSVCLPLYAAGISWTLIYDTIYAHQDKHDDVKAGVKSTALLFGDNTKVWLSGFAVTMNTALLMSGYFSDQMWPYYLAVSMTTGHLAWQISSVDLDNMADCGAKFRSNVVVGVLLLCGIVVSNQLKPREEDSTIAT